MPCRSDYMEPDAREIESRRVRTLLAEIGLINREEIGGTYGNVRHLDKDTKALCSWCRLNDVEEQSLELQIWWRDHQIADAKREAAEEAKKARRELAMSGLAKLTDAEKAALGLNIVLK